MTVMMTMKGMLLIVFGMTDPQTAIQGAWGLDAPDGLTHCHATEKESAWPADGLAGRLVAWPINRR
jgi:hypothetical protein